MMVAGFVAGSADTVSARVEGNLPIPRGDAAIAAAFKSGNVPWAFSAPSTYNPGQGDIRKPSSVRS